MSRRKILIFDDTDIHRFSASLLLSKDHDLTVVGTYDDAQKALITRHDWERRSSLRKELLAEAGLPEVHPSSLDDTDPTKVKHEEIWRKAEAMTTTYPTYDVVMTDLLVPASSQAMGQDGKKFVGQEMPLGTTIALLALCAGIKNVAVVTDMNHHHHPGSAAFDCFGECQLPGANIICTNDVSKIAIDEASGQQIDTQFARSEEGWRKYPKTSDEYNAPRKGLGWGKDWKKILDRLLGNAITV